MLAKLPFRTKLLLVAIVPLVVLIGFAGFAIRDSYTAIEEQNDDSSLLVPYRALTLAARAIADEGVASSWFAQTGSADPPASKALVFDARNATDEAVKQLRAALPELEGKVRPETLDAVRSIVLRLNANDAARGQVNTGGDPGTVFQGIADSMLAAAGEITRDVNDGELARGLGTELSLDRQQVALAREASLVISRLAGSQAGDLGEWAQAITEQDAQVRRFFESATPSLTAAYEATEAIAPSTDPIRAGSESVVPLELPATGEVAPIEYASWYVGRQAALGDGSSAVLRKVDSEFDQRRQDTRNDAILLAVITAFAVILAVGLAYAVARSVTRSLRALTRGARDVAERRLPRLVDTLRRGGELTLDQLEGFAPINVSSRDELGDLAKAFNTVQQVTVAVAEQQAELLKKGIGDLYVNLARRNQSLLDRQISLLDDMEARVEDADELGSLFELDHLATRMRRNAESLLVLSGAEQPRQWGTAVPVLDVARGAAAEIAEFTRVTYFGFEGDVAISGNAVADVSHLLAELLENATVFSPPTTPVVVTGRRVEHRYVITITDEGIGVEDERLAAINNLLARPPVTGLALSRTLGLFVVAHLAARYGIGVQLRRAPSTGVTAVVALPTAVLARIAAPTDGHAPPPAPAPVPASPAGTTPMPVVARPPEPEPEPQPELEPEPAWQWELQPDSEPQPERRPWPEPVQAREPEVRFAPDPRDADDPFAGPAPTPTPYAEPAPTREPAPASVDATGATWRHAPSDDTLIKRTPTDHRHPRGGNGHPVAGNGNGNDATVPVTERPETVTPSGLTSRTPGAHLTHTPGGDHPRVTTSEVRPRPERVAELLSRHDRGKTQGRSRGPEAGPERGDDDDGFGNDGLEWLR